MRSAGKMIRNNMLVGLMLVAPMVITGWIVIFLVRLVSGNIVTKALTNLIFELLPETLRDGSAKFFLSQFVAVLLVLAALFFIGFFVRSYFGRRLYAIGERVLGRIPVFNKIYIHVRQLSETIFSQRQTMFKEVVLVAYPRPGLHSMAFVTSTVPASFKATFPAPLPPADSGPVVALFVPTTPNPTSGMLIFAPRADLLPLPISVADAMKLIVSAGAVYPGEGEPDDRPTLLDKLEQWIVREGKIEDAAQTLDKK